MEHSSQGTDGPLLPQHNTDIRPISSGSGGPPTSPSVHQLRQGLREGFSRDGHHEEADIADPHGAQGDEKAGGASGPRPNTGNFKSASVEDEQQALDWIVPVQNGGLAEKRGLERATVKDRLHNTLLIASAEQLKYEKRAKWAGMAINAAMFAQIVSNALITGLSASSSNRQAQIGVSALGALNTVISSFLVRVRGTREPERSITHSQNLEKFIRELEAFSLDEGHSRDRKWDDRVNWFRVEFDKLQTAVHQSENGQPMSNSGQA